ncbi:MAG: histidine--tRNA ligase [Chitinophagaceae bacterium]|nr:MAG: histidine--tRNA ligase [Chitinophagaceae bacterium]
MKPSLVKGTRDFNAIQVKKRTYIFDTIREKFELFGFQPLETPAMENMSTLTGKYGDEGEKLLFKILNSGDFLKKITPDLVDENQSNQVAPLIAEKGLRYDLTIPLARYIVLNHGNLTFPFKRYQIQAVWRADRPQKGRYREFYQCDADIVGSTSVLNELELIQLYDSVFSAFGLEVSIRFNNRQILEGIASVLGVKDRFNEFCLVLDKLDKAGAEGVDLEFGKREFPQNLIDNWKSLILIKGTNREKLNFLADQFEKNSDPTSINEISLLLDYLDSAKINNPLNFDVSLARGLSYYTAFIFEVIDVDGEYGSLGGGGRYDQLTSLFGLDNMPGVGISFGADRIYDVLEKKNAFPADSEEIKLVMITNFNKEFTKKLIEIANDFRIAGIPCEIYPVDDKLKKQFRYADQKNISYVLIAGDAEIENNTFSLKNMKSGEQQSGSIEDLIEKVKKIMH